MSPRGRVVVMTNQPSIKEYRATSARQQSDETSLTERRNNNTGCCGLLLCWLGISHLITPRLRIWIATFYPIIFCFAMRHGRTQRSSLCRPNCHDTDPPCTMPTNLAAELAVDDRPPRDKGNSWDFSTTANLPLDRCTVPVNLPLTLSPSVAARKRGPYSKAISDPTPATSRSRRMAKGCAGRRRGCPGCGWRRPVRYGARGAGPWLRGLVARSRLAQGRPSRRGSAAGPARSRRPIRSVCSDRPGKGRERWPDCLGRRHGRRHGWPDHRGCAIGRRRSARRYRPGVAPPAGAHGHRHSPHSRRLERGTYRKNKRPFHPSPTALDRSWLFRHPCDATQSGWRGASNAENLPSSFPLAAPFPTTSTADPCRGAVNAAFWLVSLAFRLVSQTDPGAAQPVAPGFRVTPWSRWFRLCASGDQGSAWSL